MSQNQAAKSAGILPQRITDHLAGRRSLPRPQVQALASVLGVEAAWLDQPDKASETITPPLQGQGNPVAGLLRPIRTSLMLLTWGEALVLFRSLRVSSHTAGVDGDVSRVLLQRLLSEIGLDEAAMAAAADILVQLSRLG